MRLPFSLVPRVVAAGVLFLALGAPLSTAQPKAEASSGAPATNESTGVLVLSVQSGSPAEKAGITRGDILTEANGTAVNSAEALRALVAARAPGDTVALSIRHGDVAKVLSVVLGTRENKAYLGIFPFDAGMLAGGEWGAGGSDRGTWKPPMLRGVVVVEVAEKSPAADAGITARDIIRRVEGVRVMFPEQVVDAVQRHKPGDTMTLTVYRAVKDKETDITVTVGHNPTDAAKPWLGLSLNSFFGHERMPRLPPPPPSDDTPTL
jgi:S1-C subfamily serine protease